MFEMRELRRIIGPKEEGVRGGRRKWCYDKIYNLCSSPNIIRVIKSERMRHSTHAHEVLAGKPEEKRRLGRVRRGCKLML
jgi:hypothetical protein